jgi:glycosyltransferase involved in cell wall biosynthesis
MASGLPVIVTDAGGTAELVGDGENGLIVRWADVAGLTEALARLIDDPLICRAMGGVSRQRVKACAWSTIAATYRTLLQSLTHH